MKYRTNVKNDLMRALYGRTRHHKEGLKDFLHGRGVRLSFIPGHISIMAALKGAKA